jgi:hypothetical protein
MNLNMDSHKNGEERKSFHIKAYMKKQLIEELSLASSYEFDKIVKPHAGKVGERMGNYYTPKQVRIIFDLIQAYKKDNTKDR